MGTPDFAVPALEALVASSHQVVAVYTQPPRPAGRGQKLTKSPVQLCAEQYDLPIFHPKSLRNSEAQLEFAGLQLDAAVVAAYGLILPQPILDAPVYGCFNIHGSLLPRWRGAAPIQHAVLAGDAETGITIMQMEAGLDTGPMLVKEAVPITPATTSASLYVDLAAIGARLIVPTLEGFIDGSIKPEIQPEDGVSHAAKLSREDGKLDWHQPAAYLERQLRALLPWPGVWFELLGETVKVGAADIIALKGKPGTILDDQLTIACGQQALRLTKVLQPGGKWISGAELMRNASLSTGAILH
jgi:methionyl-tRNA formyltransferase